MKNNIDKILELHNKTRNELTKEVVTTCLNIMRICNNENKVIKLFDNRVYFAIHV